MAAGLIVDDPASGEPARPRLRPSIRRDTAVLVGLLAAYLLARLLMLWHLRVYTSFDTGSYAPRPGITEPFDTLSFTGNAPRTWGSPLLYALVSTDVQRALLQWIIGTLAWSLLVIGLWVNIRTLPARIVAAVGVLGLALTSAVYPWDFAILSEALSIGFGVMAFGLFAIWARTGSRVAATGLAVVGVWWLFSRPDVLPFIVVLGLAMAGYVVRRKDRRWTAAAVAIALVLGAGWYAGTVSRNDEAFRQWGLHVGLSEGTFVYRLRFQVYPDPQVTRVFTEKFGMPPCPAAAAVAHGRAWATGPFVRAYKSCPELVAWTNREKGSVAIRYMLADPAHFSRMTGRVMPDVLGGTAGRYAGPAKLLPRFPDSLYFPRRSWVLPGLLSLFVVALVAMLVVGAFRRRTWLAVAGVGLVLASAASAVAGTLYSAGEYGRFGIEEAVLMRVGLVIMVVAAVDAFLVGRRERSVANGTPAVVPAQRLAAEDRPAGDAMLAAADDGAGRGPRRGPDPAQVHPAASPGLS